MLKQMVCFPDLALKGEGQGARHALAALCANGSFQFPFEAIHNGVPPGSAELSNLLYREKQGSVFAVDWHVSFAWQASLQLLLSPGGCT